MRASRRALRRWVVVRFGLAMMMGLLTLSACSDSTSSSGNGALRVATVTTGPDQDNSYQVKVDGASGTTLTPNAAMTLDGLTPGNHTVGLTDIAPNCVVQGQNPVTVHVENDSTATVTFGVICAHTATSTQLQVTTHTAGSGSPSSFSVGIDSGSAGFAQTVQVPPNGAIAINLAPGEHRVWLVVPGNCTVGSAQGATITTTAGAMASLHFEATCVDGIPIPIQSTTTGEGAPASYLVIVDGTTSTTSVPANGIAQLRLAPGPHALALLTPRNCTATPASQSIVVNSAPFPSAPFTVTCASPGSIRVTVTQTGGNFDNALSVSVGGHSYPLTASSSTVIDGVGSGSQSVTLTDIAQNCSVTGANPLTVSVAAGSTTPVAFALTCLGDGRVDVTVTSTGASIPATYLVEVDSDLYYGYGTYPISPSGTTGITLPYGSHRIDLVVPPNCTVTTPNGLTVNAPPGGIVPVAFQVACTTLGTIQVSVTATGAAPGDQYTAMVDPGMFTFLVPANGTNSLSVAPGSHVVHLFVSSGNCQVTSANDVPVTVASGATASVAFTVQCVPNGTLKIHAVTTGTNAPTQYRASWGYYEEATVPANGTVSVSLSPGQATVFLYAPANCAVTPNPGSVTIVSAATADLTFNVTCQ